MEIEVLKVKIKDAAEKSQSKVVFVSPEDYHDLVESREINVEGRLMSGNATIKMDRECPVGSVRK